MEVNNISRLPWKVSGAPGSPGDMHSPEIQTSNRIKVTYSSLKFPKLPYTKPVKLRSLSSILMKNRPLHTGFLQNKHSAFAYYLSLWYCSLANQRPLYHYIFFNYFWRVKYIASFNISIPTQFVSIVTHDISIEE